MYRVTSALLALALLPLALPASAQDSAATGAYSSFVPDTSLYTAVEEPPDTALVERLFVLAFTEACNAAIDGAFGGSEPETFDLGYRTAYDEPGAPERKYRLYRFNCNGGAYNFSSVFYGWDQGDGLAPLSFAVPSLDVKYAEGDTEGANVTGVSVIGFEARAQLTNASFDAASQTIGAGAYWRGLGDASDEGVWRFREGRFVLERYDVDASYNGEVDPQRVVDYMRPEDVPGPGRTADGEVDE